MPERRTGRRPQAARRAEVLRILLVVAAGVAAGTTVAQTAEAPSWKVGDRWVFHEKSSPPDKEDTWSREVAEALPESRFSVRTAAGGKLVFDGAGNSLDRRGAAYTWQRFRFPMAVGMQWSHDRKIGGDTWSGEEKATWEVEAYEKITVPAGTFDCFRVAGKAYRNWDSTSSIAKGYNRSYTHTKYWYCPAVKWAVRWEIDENAYVSAPMTHSVSELVSFESKP